MTPCHPQFTICTPVADNQRTCDCLGNGQPILGDAAANGCSGGKLVYDLFIY